MIATIEKKEEESGEVIKSLLATNELAYTSHFLSIFNELWTNGIDAEERIKAIEQGIEPEFLDVILDPQKVSRILVDLTKSVRNEALLILPNDKAMVRADRLGVINDLMKASVEHSAAIKIICPLSEQNAAIVNRILKTAPSTKILNGNTSSAGMLIVDDTKFIRIEVKDPHAEDLIDSIGLTIYSNSRRSVDSFRSIFELLWNERMINEELKRGDSMQKEFINVAAHELPTPMQPILSLANVLRSNEKDPQRKELLDIVIRNAKRLKRLTEDLLDVTRIESQNLNLNKSLFNLSQVTLNTIADHKSQIKNDGSGRQVNDVLKLEFKRNENENDNDVFVYGDAGRVTQVLSNLLNNAIKFTDDGSITVKMEKKKKYDRNENHDNQEGEVVVSIQDTGRGIDPNIKDKLFEKFAVKSENGIGLGLYISRRIIEAHGGKIWIENNLDARGATFSFSLPLTREIIDNQQYSEAKSISRNDK